MWLALGICLDYWAALALEVRGLDLITVGVELVLARGTVGLVDFPDSLRLQGITNNQNDN